jgi:hypothetical protein
MAVKKAFVAPKQKRQYYSVQKPVSGLVMDIATTMIADTATPNCAEVRFKNGIITKAFGWTVFADTDISTPLYCSLIVPTIGSKIIVGTINVFHSPSYRTVAGRIVVRKLTSSNLVCRVSGYVRGGTSNLVSRVTVHHSADKNLVNSFIVRKQASETGYCRLTVTH